MFGKIDWLSRWIAMGVSHQVDRDHSSRLWCARMRKSTATLGALAGNYWNRWAGRFPIVSGCLFPFPQQSPTLARMQFMPNGLFLVAFKCQKTADRKVQIGLHHHLPRQLTWAENLGGSRHETIISSTIGSTT